MLEAGLDKKWYLLERLFFNTYFFLYGCSLSLSMHAQSNVLLRSTYVVHMNKNFMPNVFSNYHNWYLSLVDKIKYSNLLFFDDHQSIPSIIYSYDNAIHGFSAALSPKELVILKKYRGYISSYPDKVISFHTYHSYPWIPLPQSFLRHMAFFELWWGYYYWNYRLWYMARTPKF